MRATKVILAAVLLTGPVLAGCSTSTNFDPTDALDKLDFLNLNKEEKLKGERKPLFPEGVPGVTQGIPPDLVKGHQQPVETAAAPAVEEPPPEKPKPKPRVVRRAEPKPAVAKPAPMRVQVGPAEQPQQQTQPQQAQPQQARQQQQTQQGAQSPWPAPAQQQTSPWPDAPPPNTFQR